MFDREADRSPDIRLRAWEIWPKEARHQHFTEFMTNYFEKNYSVKKELAAPANFHPLKFDFYMCNPVRTLDALLVNSDGLPGESSVEIIERVSPCARSGSGSPVDCLSHDPTSHLDGTGHVP